MADPPFPRNRAEAQRRADRIRAFRNELAQARSEGAVDLTADQEDRLARYHEALLGRLGREFDVDVTEGQKTVSLGMQVVALLGGLALAASVVLLFFRIWGLIPTTAQVGLLVAAPIAALAAVDWTARRGELRFTTIVVAAVAFAAFVLDLQALGTIFAITPTVAIFLSLALFALVLAYGYDSRLLLATGLVCLALYLAAVPSRLAGAWWGTFLDLWEGVLLAGAAVFALSLVSQPRRVDFPPVFRMVGLAGIFLSLLVMSYNGNASWMPGTRDSVETVYQVASFVVSGGLLALGVLRRWPETVYLSAGAFIVYLVGKFFDWWWELLPRWLFFLLLGILALVLLWLFRRLRGRLAEAR